MKLTLKKLVPGADRELYRMTQEIGAGENGFVNGFYTDDPLVFEQKVLQYADMSQGLNLADGWVPQTIYWFFADEWPVGYGKLRHRLNDSLLERGGHIGYVIRPSARGKGYGKLALQGLVEQANEMGITELLLTCDESNVASRKVIEHNRGKLREVNEGICKYWINK